MYDDLTTTTRGQKELPAQVPRAMDSVKAMRGNPNVISGLQWARLDEAYTYLRLGNTLKFLLNGGGFCQKHRHWRDS